MRQITALALALLLASGTRAQANGPMLSTAAGADTLARPDTPRRSREAQVDSLSLRKGREALWRSAALDGWGQAHNQEWIKALVFCGAEIAIVTGGVTQHNQWRQWQRRRRAATDPVWIAYDMSREDFYLRDRNKLIWWWLWLKLGCTLDAYVSGSMSNFDAEWGRGLSLAPSLIGDTPGLELRWTPGALRQGGGR